MTNFLKIMDGKDLPSIFSVPPKFKTISLEPFYPYKKIFSVINEEEGVKATIGVNDLGFELIDICNNFGEKKQ